MSQKAVLVRKELCKTFFFSGFAICKDDDFIGSLFSFFVCGFPYRLADLSHSLRRRFFYS